jgi:hypothetical protein
MIGTEMVSETSIILNQTDAADSSRGVYQRRKETLLVLGIELRHHWPLYLLLTEIFIIPPKFTCVFFQLYNLTCEFCSHRHMKMKSTTLLQPTVYPHVDTATSSVPYVFLHPG